MVERPASRGILTTADGCTYVDLPEQKPMCADAKCRWAAQRARDELALADAIERGVIVENHPEGYDDQWEDE